MTKEKISIGFRWMARITSVLMIMIFIAFALGEGVNFSALTSQETGMFVCVGLMLAGLLLGLGKPVAGCVLVLAGYIGFSLTSRSLLLDTPFVAFPVIVCLYLVSWFLGRKEKFQLPV